MGLHLRDLGLNKPVPSRVIFLTILFVGMGIFALQDYFRVDNDFQKLKRLLQDTRNRAINLDKTMVVRFSGQEVIVRDYKTGKVISSLRVPTLHRVNYDTTIGDNMIVFDGHGTEFFNKRVHGGDLRLKSWLGFRKNIAVNCTGLVTEGVYPE